MENFSVIEGSPLWIFQKILKNTISSTDVGEKSFFRLNSDPLRYRGSKNTNLTSVQFCKGRPVAPARCVKRV